MTGSLTSLRIRWISKTSPTSTPSFPPGTPAPAVAEGLQLRGGFDHRASLANDSCISMRPEDDRGGMVRNQVSTHLADHFTLFHSLIINPGRTISQRGQRRGMGSTRQGTRPTASLPPQQKLQLKKKYPLRPHEGEAYVALASEGSAMVLF